MKLVKTLSGDDLSPVGIGTYGIGGRGHTDVPLREVQDDDKYIRALMLQFKLGYNFAEISWGYGHNNAARLFGQALKTAQIKREDIFITNSLYPRDLHAFGDIATHCDRMRDALGVDMFDSVLVTQSLLTKFGYDPVVDALWEMLVRGKTRYVSISNASVPQLLRFHDEFKRNLFAHETHLSFEVRVCEDEGLFATADFLGVQSIVWRPLRQGKTAAHNWPLLTELAGKYGRTQNQIILNWMGHLGIKPIVFSSSAHHIHENWEAFRLQMDSSDYYRLTEFRVPDYEPKFDWDRNGNGDSIVPLVMGFEEQYGMMKV